MNFWNLLLLLFLALLINIDSKAIKPVIAIYGNSDPENDDESFLNGTYYPISYVYWLESLGAEVMALHYWYSYEEIDEILQKINGVLFLGGSRDIHKEGTWEKKAKYIMMKSMEYDLPFWGTCQGFQLIGTLLSDNYTLLKQAYDDVNVLHSLEINKNTRKSKMYRLFTPSEIDLLVHTNSTIYNHHWGFFPNEYHNEQKLEELTIVTSDSEDHNGTKFVNSYEGKNDKIFAVQFHPEKNPFKRIDYNVEQNIESLKVSQKLGLNFIELTRRNQNKFLSNINDEGDRAKYDFFNTYNGTKNCNYKKEICYFYKQSNNI